MGSAMARAYAGAAHPCPPEPRPREPPSPTRGGTPPTTTREVGHVIQGTTTDEPG